MKTLAVILDHHPTHNQLTQHAHECAEYYLTQLDELPEDAPATLRRELEREAVMWLERFDELSGLAEEER